MGLRKNSTKICAQLHVFSLWRLTWVFDGTWKNFHKKVCPVTRFFAVETILSFWWDLESFGKKMWPVTHLFRSADYLKFLMGLGKFRQKGVTIYTFFSLWRLTWVFEFPRLLDLATRRAPPFWKRKFRERLIDWATGWTDWLADWLIDWLTVWGSWLIVVARLFRPDSGFCLRERLTDWGTDWLLLSLSPAPSPPPLLSLSLSLCRR